MAHALHVRGRPRDLADSRQAIEFEGILRDFERLTRIVRDDLERLPAANRPQDWRSRPVSVSLEFAWADVQKHVPAVNGRLSATLPAVCQRCLEACELVVEVELHHLLVALGQSVDGLGDYDVWELTEQELSLQTLVEEALIMALPLAAMHESTADCGPLADELQSGSAEPADTVRPFAGLKALLDEHD